ncbi:MAG: hypothetical protein ACI865_003367, partial [Flavobacteriaceae bacterium]
MNLHQLIALILFGISSATHLNAQVV